MLMRTMILGSMTAVIVTALGIAALKAAGMPDHLPAALAALGAAVLACILAGIPLALTDRSSPVASAQAALMGTVIHLLVLAAAGGIVILGRFSLGKVLLDRTFVYWLALLYAATLAALVAGTIRTIRVLPPADGKI
jgi:hypothetical protein